MRFKFHVLLQGPFSSCPGAFNLNGWFSATFESTWARIPEGLSGEDSVILLKALEQLLNGPFGETAKL